MLRPLRVGGAAACAAAALALALPSAATAAPPPALDPAFGRDGLALAPAAIEIATTVAPSADGGAVLAGYAPAAGPTQLVARLRRDGSPDPAFGDGGVVGLRHGETGKGIPRNLLVDDAGRIVVVGDWEEDGATEISVARLLPDGSLDPAFSDDGLLRVRLDPATTSSSPLAAALMPGGGVAIAGAYTSGGAAVVNTLTTIDAAGRPVEASRPLGWPLPMTVAGLAATPAGGFVLAGGSAPDAMLALRTPALGPAPGFPDPLVQSLAVGYDELTAVAVAADGRIYAVGSGDEEIAPDLFRTGGISLVAELDGSARRWATIPAPGAATGLMLSALAFDDGAPVAGGLAQLPDDTHRLAFAALGADGLPDPARSGLQTVALPAWAGQVSPADLAFDASGHAVAIVSAREENRRFVAVARVDVSPPAGGGQQPGPEPGRDPQPGPGPQPDPNPKPGSRRPRFAPVAAFSAVGAGPVRTLGGTVADGARHVEVAVARRDGKRCRAVASTPPRLGGVGRCAPARWLRASGRRAWRLTLRRPLPRGRYLAWVRAVGAPGTTARPFSARAGNRIAFTVRR
jgi:uncharacterized delta-60 repeat protein